MKRIVLSVVVGLCVSGCAQRAEEIRAASVSPILYQNLNCVQIAQETARVSAKAAELTGVQNQRATTDAVATGVAIVVFWPAAFLIRGDGANAGELSRLKGEMEALEAVSNQKKCGIQFNREPAPRA